MQVKQAVNLDTQQDAAVKIIRKMGKLERRKIFKMKKSGLSGMEQDSSDDEE